MTSVDVDNLFEDLFGFNAPPAAKKDKPKALPETKKNPPEKAPPKPKVDLAALILSAPPAPPKPPAPPEPPKWVAPSVPENWVAPEFRDCGHFDFWEKKDEKGQPFCHACKERHPVAWSAVKGEFIRPMPKSSRRSLERSTSGGYAGYCADAEGYYIGGQFNDCRRDLPKEQWCSYHRTGK